MSQTLKALVNDQMKSAMRAKDKARVLLMRQLKSAVQEALTSKGFSGEEDDALWSKVIESYAKNQKKVLQQYEALGEAGETHCAQLRWELEALEPFLPKRADEATTRAWVAEIIAGLGDRETLKLGPIMGQVMRAHKDEADPALVRRCVAEALGS
ncbi:MAG: GatB/YqeY domain-containing protein [Myxococcota bacterium]|nr:GatB/YqeY domain-containing protein [Myxococcota bacterium]